MLFIAASYSPRLPIKSPTSVTSLWKSLTKLIIIKNSSLIKLSYWEQELLLTFMACSFQYTGSCIHLQLYCLVHSLLRQLSLGSGTHLHLMSNEKVVEFSYVFFFTLEHTVLFLYPCFRAASITAALHENFPYIAIYSWLIFSVWLNFLLKWYIQ